MALSYDSVQLFAETTKYLPVRNAPLNCSDRSESVLDHGSTFKNYMRTVFGILFHFTFYFSSIYMCTFIYKYFVKFYLQFDTDAHS